MKTLSVSDWHREVFYHNGPKVQHNKIISELLELYCAILDNDIDKIKEELCDVENILPYLSLIYIKKVQHYDIEYGGDLKYTETCLAFVSVLNAMSRTSNRDVINPVFKILLKNVLYGLFNLYDEYNIEYEEIECLKAAKKLRTLRRIHEREQ